VAHTRPGDSGRFLHSDRNTLTSTASDDSDLDDGRCVFATGIRNSFQIFIINKNLFLKSTAPGDARSVCDSWSSCCLYGSQVHRFLEITAASH